MGSKETHHHHTEYVEDRSNEQKLKEERLQNEINNERNRRQVQLDLDRKNEENRIRQQEELHRQELEAIQKKQRIDAINNQIQQTQNTFNLSISQYESTIRNTNDILNSTNALIDKKMEKS